MCFCQKLAHEFVESRRRVNSMFGSWFEFLIIFNSYDREFGAGRVEQRFNDSCAWTCLFRKIDVYVVFDVGK
jgi:hypothetical protein